MFNKKVRALLIADAFWFFGEGLLGPLFAIFAGKVGGDLLQITWAWATYLIVSGALIMLIGKMSDRLNKRKMVFYGYILNALLTFGYLLVQSPIHLFLIQAGLGVAAAMATPTWNALYSENVNKRKDGFEWGLADGSSELLTGFATLLGGVIVTLYSFNALFIIMGIVQIVSVIILKPILDK